jgi:hypothetical protein
VLPVAANRFATHHCIRFAVNGGNTGLGEATLRLVSLQRFQCFPQFLQHLLFVLQLIMDGVNSAPADFCVKFTDP